MGITRERVRQIQVKAEEKLEKRVAEHGFGDGLQSPVAESSETEFEENSL